jgi:hypothetical protein
MSLFSKLLSLSTGSILIEDFFTEIIAYLFARNPDLLCKWLDSIGIIDASSYTDFQVDTQRSFKPLDGHSSGSRPDISIEAINQEDRILVFIESKIDSSEGFDQLKRYADLLHAISGFDKKILIYITRDFDPKKMPQKSYRKVLGSEFYFKQARWHQFYNLIKSRSHEDFLIREVLAFMERHNMSCNNQFSSIDIIALTNFTQSLKLMDEIMWGEVKVKFKDVVGHVKKNNAALTEISRYGRYLMMGSMPEKWDCGLGFILNASALNHYPRVHLVLQVDPNSSHRQEIISAMKDICEKYGWQQLGLEDPKCWSRIFREKSLQHFLSTEDHVSEIKKFFLESLDELSEIKKTYSELPWGVN